MTADGPAELALRALLAAAEPPGSKPLGGLVTRLAATGRLRAVRAPSGGEQVDDLPVAGIAYDSRRVVRGGCFVAVPGHHVDGHAFLPTAIGTGAAVLVVERPLDTASAGPAIQLVVDSSQRALATVAAWWFEDPAADLGIIGITGTDGKTTTAGLAVAALEAAGVRTGLVSTAEQKVGSLRAGALTHVTTPEAPELQLALRAIGMAGDVAAVVESTSHGLALERVGEIPYDAAIFTNLSHEHLEFHGTFEAYRDAKVSLFARLAAGPAGRPKPSSLPGGRPWPRGGIVNADDPNAAPFAEATRRAGARLLTFGLSTPADVRALEVVEDRAGLRARVRTPRGEHDLLLRLVGRFNVSNALAVVALGELLELDPAAVRAGLEAFPGVRGRMERVDRGQPFAVVVDYAHTPASLATALDVLAPRVGPGGGLIAVFGSAGERDVAKRAIQGRVAGERCRLVVATDEDPRGEDPLVILEQIAAGAVAAGKRRGEDLLLIPDRRAAIDEALALARPGDVVLLAGKGHETEILYADHARPWDERSVVEELLAERGFEFAAFGCASVAVGCAGVGRARNDKDLRAARPMRSCLSFVVFVGLLLGLITWFVLPPLAGWVVVQVLPADALRGSLAARVDVDFPPELLMGHADAVALSGSGVTAARGELVADELAVTLHDVRFLDRVAARVDGRLSGVNVVQDGKTVIRIDRIDVGGPTGSLAVTVTIGGDEARRRAQAALDNVISLPISSVTLQAPDRVTASAVGASVSGRLAIQDGSLVVVVDAPLPTTVVVVPASATGPLHLTSVRITDGGLVLRGGLDAVALGVSPP